MYQVQIIGIQERNRGQARRLEHKVNNLKLCGVALETWHHWWSPLCTANHVLKTTNSITLVETCLDRIPQVYTMMYIFIPGVEDW